MSDCSCIYVGDFDSPTTFRKSIRVSHKERRCEECGEVIPVGNKCEFISTKWEWNDKPLKYYTCLDCVSVKNVFFCDGYFYGQIWEYVNNHIQELQGVISSDCLVSLTKKARDKVCDMIEEIWKEDDDDEEEN